MRYATCLASDGPRLAAIRSGEHLDLTAADPQLPRSLKAVLASPELRDRAEKAARGARAFEVPFRVTAPIPDPEKVICIGLNYADHAIETGAKIPSDPVVFCKFPTTICGPGDSIELPAVSQSVDYEAELVAVIGRTGRDIPLESALQYVAGYCCGHDVSARDWQKDKPGGQWLLGKSFDTFAPIGPCLATSDEIGDPGNLAISLRINGQTMQNSSTRQLIFPVAKLVSYVSQVCTLKPGDLIFTGTPAGVGMARKPPVFLKPGDNVEVEIEKIGILANPVVSRPAG